MAQKYVQTNILSMETTTKTKTIPSISSEGEFYCILIYPDKKHVSNYSFAPILDTIRTTLKNKGFKLRELSGEIKDLEQYIDKFVNIAKECVYGVVILDGLRPNVLIELGILIGLNKPFTLLMSKDAEISVKTLYDNYKEAGLTSKQFGSLRNPKIKIGGGHLSDFSSHLSIFDPEVFKDDPKHVSTKLEESIERMKNLITKEYQKIVTKDLPKIKPEYLEEYQTILIDIFRYYFKDVEFDLNDIKMTYKKLRDFEGKVGVKSPTSTRSIIGSLFTSLVRKGEWKNINELKKYFDEALNVYNEALEYETKDPQKAEIQLKIGNVYWKLSQYIEPDVNCKKAIKSYEEALKVYTLERFPMDYAMTQNNLGIAYSMLAEVENKADNCKKAIKACEEALKVYTLERFPTDYAMTQNNLGNAYRTLAEVENKADNCKKAIKSYKEALKVYTLERFPMDYAMTQNNLGIAYSMLAEVENKADNCKKAIKACEEALKVRTLERLPMDYAMTQNNLGNAYGMLAEVENKAKNCKKAINAYEEALKVYTLERFPMDYARTQNNLGNAYRMLAEVENKAENCKKAIKACEEALKVRTLERLPMDYAMTQNNLGNAYGRPAEVENKADNCKKAIKAYEEALKVYTLERLPMDYAMTQNNLGTAYSMLAEVENKAENCKKAIEAYEKALMVFTREKFPEIYPFVEQNLRKLLHFCDRSE